MMSILKTTACSLFILLFGVIGLAQEISIQVLVPTSPPPTTLSEILSFESEVIILLNNTSSQIREIKLVAGLTNTSTGLSVQMRRDIPSITPIVLPPGQIREFRFRELQSRYGEITEGDFILNGVNYDQIIREERLPEGYYSLCIEALDFYTNELLSIEGSCGFFPIIAYDPPIIIYPESEAEITATTPQNIIFTWTPTGLPQTTKYRFQLVNTEDYQFANPLDVFNYENEVFTYQQNNLSTTFFQYDISKPPLQEGATYALRVQAYDDNNELNYRNNGWSEPSHFTYLPVGGGIAPIEPNFTDEPAPPNLVVDACVTYNESISTTLNTSVSAEQMVWVGAFAMEIDQISFQTGQQTYAGAGTIHIDFLNQDIAVAFESIRINTNMRVYGEGSIVHTVNENTNITGLGVSSNYDTPQDFGFPLNFQSYLNSRRTPIAAPLGVPFKIRSTDAVVNALIFTPQQSKAKLGIPVPYPNVGANGTPYIPYYNNDVCITPSGYVNNELTFTLSEDIELPFQNNLVTLTLPQSGNQAYLNAADDMRFDITGNLVFDRSLVRYESSLQDVSFNFQETNILSWNTLIDAELATEQRVVYPLLRDLPIALNTIKIDLSDQVNHPQFDQKYPGESSLWQGIYCPQINIQLPAGLGGNSLNFNASGLALSGNGFSLNTNRQSTVVGLQNGRLAQWPFSINEFALDIWEGDLNGGSFGGKLRLPIQQSGGIDYTAIISSSDNQLDLDLTASTLSDFDVPMWKARLEVFEGSAIGLDKVSGNYRLLAHLNGRLSVEFENPAAQGALSQLNIPALAFEDFTIEGRDIPGFVPTLDFSYIELENPNQPQLSFEYFDFTLQDIAVSNPAGQPNRYGLELDLGLSLFGGDIANGPFGAGASTKLTVWARWQNQFQYDDIELQAITGELDLGIAEASVAIQLFNRDAVFGNGFKGDADVALKTSGAAFGAGFSIQFGKADNYRYWYFDGYYKGIPGIVLGPSGVSIYGFGGGGYYNMAVSEPPAADPDTYNSLAGSEVVNHQDPAATHSDIQFTPQRNNGGFLANSIIGSSASPAAWNVKSHFLMDFSRHPNFAINSVRFDGSLKMMQPLEDDSNPDFNLTTSSQTDFSLLVQRNNQSRTIHASVHHELSGLFSSISIPVDFHSTYNLAQNSRQWYLHIGSWSQANPFDDDARITIKRGIDTPVFKSNTDIRAYMMMGNHFPPPTYPGLPPLPDYITNQSDDAGNTGVNRSGADADNILNAMDASTSNGFGIGLGVGVQANFGLDVAVFYADMSAEVVLDGLLRKTEGCGDGSPLGFNDWYLLGQAYAYVSGEVGARVRFLGRTLSRSLVNVHAGALLQAELPRPTWLNGRVWIGGEILGGRIRFKPRRVSFDFGDRCEDIQGGDSAPFAELDYISEFIPGDGKQNVSVFVDPRVAFNVNDGEIIELTDLEGEEHTYRVNFEYELREQGSNRLVQMQEINWNDARSTLRLTPREWLEEHTWYNFTIRIKGYERINGQWGSPIYESSETAAFKTGAKPSQFILEDIVSSYPGFKQRYFMTRQDNGQRTEGWLQMDKTVCAEILAPHQASNMEEGHIIRFTNIRTREPVETSCWCKNDKTLAFNLPADRLDREEIYRVNIGFREREGYFTANPGNPDDTESTYAANTDVLTTDANDPGRYEQLQNVYTDKSEFVNKFKYTNLLDPQAQWYAQTSRYESYQQKLSSFSVEQTVYIPRMIGYSYEADLPLNPLVDISQSGNFGKVFHVPVILLNQGINTEPFDHFDIVGYQHPLADGGRVDPILNPFHAVSYYHLPQMVSIREDQYFQNLGDLEMRNLIHEITYGSPTHRPDSYPFFGEVSRYGPLKRWMQGYNQLEGDLQSAGYNLTIQRPAHPLRDEEINRFLDGASDQAAGNGFEMDLDPTHGNSGIGDHLFGIYTPYTPPAAGSGFQVIDEPSDVDFDPGFDVQSNFDSYYALIDWTPRILNQDRKKANLHAVEQVEARAGWLTYARYFQALDLLDQKFIDTGLPFGTYSIKLVNELDKTFKTLPYQVNR